MVIAPLAAAAAPVVVQSATNDEGLINKLFKIGVLIGILVLAVISIVILSWILEISDILGAASGALGAVGSFVLDAAGFGVFGLIPTFVISAYGFFGKRG